VKERKNETKWGGKKEPKQKVEDRKNQTESKG
jgi:hypothetical protein